MVIQKKVLHSMSPQWFELNFSQKCFKVSKIKICLLDSIRDDARQLSQWTLETTLCDAEWTKFAKNI